MTKPIADPGFWRERLARAERLGERHRAAFECSAEQWRRIEAAHRRILARHVRPADSILDAGCGWGRLLSLLPGDWAGRYLGVDLSPDFLELARQEHSGHTFIHADLRDLSAIHGCYTYAVLVSVRPMVKRELGEKEWERMEAELRRVARNLMYLEYDPDCKGFVE